MAIKSSLTTSSTAQWPCFCCQLQARKLDTWNSQTGCAHRSYQSLSSVPSLWTSHHCCASPEKPTVHVDGLSNASQYLFPTGTGSNVLSQTECALRSHQSLSSVPSVWPSSHRWSSHQRPTHWQYCGNAEQWQNFMVDVTQSVHSVSLAK